MAGDHHNLAHEKNKVVDKVDLQGVFVENYIFNVARSEIQILKVNKSSHTSLLIANYNIFKKHLTSECNANAYLNI